MEMQKFREFIQNPPMYGSFFLAERNQSWYLMRLTFGGPEVDWDTIRKLTPEELMVAREEGLKEWA